MKDPIDGIFKPRKGGLVGPTPPQQPEFCAGDKAPASAPPEAKAGVKKAIRTNYSADGCHVDFSDEPGKNVKPPQAMDVEFRFIGIIFDRCRNVIKRKKEFKVKITAAAGSYNPSAPFGQGNTIEGGVIGGEDTRDPDETRDSAE